VHSHLFLPLPIVIVFRQLSYLIVDLIHFPVLHLQRDGMNLVSYEYVACQSDNAGVLVLSEFAGGWVAT